MLTVENLWKSFQTPQGDLTVLKGVSLQVAAGESVALMGESGSGKSTLLHVIAGLEPADDGAVLIDGTDVTALREADRAALRRTQISLIFQQFNLITSLTVRDNLAFQARLAGRHDPVWQAKLAEKLGLEDLQDRYPEELSGGQQQRVAIGRTFAARPALVLADEPTGNLDDENSRKVIDLAYDLIDETGCSLLMATHSKLTAARAHRTLHLRAGHLT